MIDAKQYLKLCLSRKVPLLPFFTAARLNNTNAIPALISRFQAYIRTYAVHGRVYHSQILEDGNVAIIGDSVYVVTTDPCYLFRTENGQVFIACKNIADEGRCTLFAPERPVTTRPPGIRFFITK